MTQLVPDSRYTLHVGSGATPRIEPLDYIAGGSILASSGTYATARAMTDPDIQSPSAYVGQSYDVMLVYNCWQCNWRFDLNSLPEGVTTVSVATNLMLVGDVSDTDFTIEMREYDWADPFYASPIAGASLSGYTLLASLSTAGIAPGSITLTAEAALLTRIAQRGTLNVNVSSSRQRLNNTPTGDEYVHFSRDRSPRLLVTYQAAIGDEITVAIDAESLVYGSTLRGYGSLEAEAILEDCNEVVANGLRKGVDVVLRDNGVTAWEGEVVSLPFAAPDDPSQQIICAGRWDAARRHEGYDKWFVSDDIYASVVELPVGILGVSALTTRHGGVVFDTDNQILISVPNGTVYKAGQGFVAGFWLFDGQDPHAVITRVECEYTINPGSNWNFDVRMVEDIYGGRQFPVEYIVSSPVAVDGTIAADVATDCCRAILFVAYADADGTTSADRYMQVRKLEVYAGTQATRRIDEAIAEILVTDSCIANSATTTAIGSALHNLVIPPDDTIAGAIEKIEARHSLPVLAGIWEGGELVVKAQPTTPPDRTRWYEVGTQDGVGWNIQLDEEAAVDYVKVGYEVRQENLCLQPTPTSTTWPSDWSRSTTTNCTASDYGGGNYRFHLTSNSTELNPVAVYRPTGGSGNGIAVVGGMTYVIRCRARNYNWSVGTCRVRANWYTSAGTLIAGGSSNIYSVAAADTTEAWREMPRIAPYNAAWLRITLEWTGASGTPSQAMFVRDVTVQPFSDAETRLTEWVPNAPGDLSARVATIDAGYQTQAGAIAAGEQYLVHYQAQASGGVEIPDYVRDIDGRTWPLSHVRAWDWVQHSGYVDPARRGPFMITSCEVSVADNVARLGIGGVDTYAYDPPEKARRAKGRFVGAAVIWKRVRVKVRGRWKWVRRRVLRKARYQ